MNLPGSESNAVRQRLVDHLMAHAVKRGDFILKSGRKSSWFIDAKQTICAPDGLRLVLEAAFSVLPADATAVGGMTMGADPLSFALAGAAAVRGQNLKAFSVRKEAKDHGVLGRIAGVLDPGDRVVLTEDTVTRGRTLAEAAEVVRGVGAQPVLMLAVVDRGGTCERVAGENGIAFAALVRAPDLGFDYDEI
ncbi:MAG: orotate phosphoribosyltransferase [Actinomycetota bacterium]|jgi:orotate phosphoribosyltransferase|nr:orotate phosphoribosyltransferase [Actinomycetota bacterium]